MTVQPLTKAVKEKLRNVAISHKKEPIPFFALRLEAVPMIVPSEHEVVPNVLGATTEHKVMCLLRGAMVTGKLEILENLRVSDYLMRSPGYIPLRDCTLRVPAKVQLPFPNPVPLVLVNAECVTGVAEEG